MWWLILVWLPQVTPSKEPTPLEQFQHTLQQGCLNTTSEWVCFLHQGASQLSDIAKEYGLEESKNNISATKNEEERTWRITRRNIVPILVAVAVKFFSFVPLVLGKLVILGAIAMLASKVSLILSLVISLKKFFGGGGFVSLNPLGYHYPPPQHHHHYDGHAGDSHRRTTYIIRGRNLKEEPQLEGIRQREEVQDKTREDSEKEGLQLQRPSTENVPTTAASEQHHDTEQTMQLPDNILTTKDR